MTPDKLHDFVYRLVDAIVLTNTPTRQADINYFLGKGIENRKIILWENKAAPEIYTAKAPDGSEVAFMEGLEFHLRNKENIDFFYAMHNYFTRQKLFYALPSSSYKNMIEKQCGQKIDWENPKTFREKIQWMKLYDSTPIKTRLADKYLVRQWVADKIGEQYLIPLLGVWDNFDDIDFDLLPNQFVLKCNHGCGYNIIVRDKKTFDKQAAREKINAWLDLDFGTFLYELHYNNIKKKIIAEKFISDGKNIDLIDYKFICFQRKPFYCFCCTNRFSDLRFDYFDMNWNHMKFERADHLNSEHPEKIQKPKTFKLMKKLAAELCKDFDHVRVDFYEVNGQVYFGEMTFTPGAGVFRYKSAGTDEYFGSLITLPPPTEFKPLFQ